MFDIAPSDDEGPYGQTHLLVYYAVVGFSDARGALEPVEVTYVADLDFARELTDEDQAHLARVGVYRMTPGIGGQNHGRAELVESTGPLPVRWTSPTADDLISTERA